MPRADRAPPVSIAAGALQPCHGPETGWRNVVVVAGGPSLTEEQCELVAAARARDACRVIVINSTSPRVSSAGVLYAGGHKWWQHKRAAVRAGLAGELVTSGRRSRDAFGIGCVHREHEPGLSRNERYNCSPRTALTLYVCPSLAEAVATFE